MRAEQWCLWHWRRCKGAFHDRAFHVKHALVVWLAVVHDPCLQSPLNGPSTPHPKPACIMGRLPGMSQPQLLAQSNVVNTNSLTLS
jgi:hypothetical protein